MGELTGGSQAELRCGIVERLAAAQKSAPLSRRLVGEAAAACGVAESTMWRWIARDGPPSRPRRGVVPSERAVELLLVWRGNVAAVHRQLVEEGEEVPSVRTLARAFERGLSLAQRDLARRGEVAVRDRAVYLRHEARFRGECYEGDHKQLSIEVLAPRAQRPQRPWVTLFVDQFSRLIVGWAMSLRPTQAEVLAALRMSVTIDPERRGFGGVPVLLRWDRGLEFAADSIDQATLALGCVSQRTDAYCPWQKGKIERLNRTIEQELLRGLPGWTGRPRDVRGRLVDQTPWLDSWRCSPIGSAPTTRGGRTRRWRAARRSRCGGLTRRRCARSSMRRLGGCCSLAAVMSCRRTGSTTTATSTSLMSCGGWPARRSRSRTCPMTGGGSRCSTRAGGWRPPARRSSSTRPRVRACSSGVAWTSGS